MGGHGLSAPPGASIITQTLLRSAQAPKFDGQLEDWAQFVRDWNEFLNLITEGRPTPDQQILALLRNCLCPPLQMQLDLLKKESQGKVTFSEAFAVLENQFGQNRVLVARKNWLAITLQIPGKLSIREWRYFETQFKLALSEIPDVTPHEARGVLLEKLPPYVKSWIGEAENHEKRFNPTFHICLPEGMNEPDVVATLQSVVGCTPAKVEVLQNGVWKVKFKLDPYEPSPTSKIIALHGKVPVGGGVPSKCASWTLRWTFSRFLTG